MGGPVFYVNFCSPQNRSLHGQKLPRIGEVSWWLGPARRLHLAMNIGDAFSIEGNIQSQLLANQHVSASNHAVRRFVVGNEQYLSMNIEPATGHAVDGSILGGGKC
jgi:hypothetical protein